MCDLSIKAVYSTTVVIKGVKQDCTPSLNAYINSVFYIPRDGKMCIEFRVAE